MGDCLAKLRPQHTRLKLYDNDLEGMAGSMPLDACENVLDLGAACRQLRHGWRRQIHRITLRDVGAYQKQQIETPI